ncbi:hypothetical protein BY458DRAFT_540663 [Sporodiniella umbellata]|nr:hypothetical protein BY458DRAFT_540663 [Sporodiniella umbellata]
MKLFTIFSGAALVITGTVAQLTSAMRNYNVTSPVPNGPYVAGQVLPCTVTIPETATDISLSIKLNSASSTNTSFVIAQKFDTSKTSGTRKNKYNETYYEHSFNYNIPTNITPGVYNVIFLDSLTNSQLDVPINVLPVASSTSKSASGTGSSSTTSSTNGSVFKSNANTLSVSFVLYLAIFGLVVLF